MSGAAVAVQPVAEARGRARGRDDGEYVDVEGYRPLLPEGQWFEAKYVGHHVTRIFNAHKVIVNFEIVEPGNYFGVKLIRPFRVKQVVRAGVNGKFKLGARSDLLFALSRLLDYKIRMDRVSLQQLKSMLLRVRTRTVRTTHDGRQTPDWAHYSVVDEIVRGE